jgi:hypothetical protein
MDNRPCHSLDLNGERILSTYPKSSGVLLTDGDEEGSVAIPTALVYDLILALHDYKDGDAVPPVTDARWKQIAQERGDLLDDFSTQNARLRAEVAALRECRCAGAGCRAAGWLDAVPVTTEAAQ